MLHMDLASQIRKGTFSQVLAQKVVSQAAFQDRVTCQKVHLNSVSVVRVLFELLWRHRNVLNRNVKILTCTQ